ncbi:MAG: rhodanese-like domain-containing protein [Spirochaetaceae bacterium]|nr:rhodanese-like domain-containing protein [Spirochaetaceae bacterium]
MKRFTTTILLLMIISSSMLFASGNKEIKKIDNKDEQTMAKYHNIEAQDAKKMIDEKADFYLIDVRTQEEYDFSHIPTAKNIPLDVIGSKASSAFSSKDAKIVIYCRSGARSRMAVNELVNLGYTEIYDLGGIMSWPYDMTN